MRTEDIVALLAEDRQDQLVVSALGVVGNAWYAASQSENETFYMHSAMGMASSFSMGLALALPERLIWTLDGDGAISMNLGMLLTLAETPPRNLTHFIFNSGAYESIGGHPLPGCATADYAAMARAAGIAHAYTLDNLADLKALLPTITAGEHYSFVVLRIEHETTRVDNRKKAPDQTRGGSPSNSVEVALKFIRYIERSEGIKVL
ncbi:MAG: sulfopyruvate decarboxylase subunit beta [Chloroflexi bacterium]|nr:sulfopyruvate decarboxylase subunit beta [Chloroflexota bacterium]